MYGAPLGDLEQPGALFGVERSLEHDRAADPVDLARPGHTLFAVHGVDPIVLQSHGDVLERLLYPIRVRAHGHRRACAEGGE